MKNVSASSINIFTFDDYRLFLKEFFKQSKTSGKKMSLRSFSAQAGFKSTNFLSLILNGKRGISEETATQIGKILRLNRSELSYFRALVKFNQATSVEERKSHAAYLLRFKEYEKLHPLTGMEFNYYSKWYYVAIRELVNTSDFREDPVWIASHLSPAISSEQAHEALAELKKLGLVVYEKGKLTNTHGNIATAAEVHSAFIKAFHQEMIKKGSECIERFHRNHREVSSVTMTMDEESFLKIKEMIQNFEREIVKVKNQAKKASKVYQLNFQLFPLVKPDES